MNTWRTYGACVAWVPAFASPSFVWTFKYNFCPTNHIVTSFHTLASSSCKNWSISFVHAIFSCMFIPLACLLVFSEVWNLIVVKEHPYPQRLWYHITLLLTYIHLQTDLGLKYHCFTILKTSPLICYFWIKSMPGILVEAFPNMRCKNGSFYIIVLFMDKASTLS